ncbi:MAG TPA: ATP-binding protein [Thermoanaerobaculia bacterium]|nr:ATP-binding protein [Thermoanaerobaculia bacterium]
MPLSELLRTTSFRVALLLLALFSAASVFLYVQTAGYITGEDDEWLASKQAELAAASPAIRREQLGERPVGDRDVEGRSLSALFDAAGNWLGGSRVSLPQPFPPLDRAFEFERKEGGKSVPFRGLLHRLPSGEILLVSRDVSEEHEFRGLLAGAMAWGWFMVLVTGLAGAAVSGAGTLRRLDAVAGAIERIVGGNLSERLPAGESAGDLGRLIRVVNGMLDDLERLMQEVKGVSDGIAHDLRTPLTRLLAGLERAHRRAASAGEYAAAVEEAIVETRGILSSFSAMLRISELEDGARRAGFSKLDLVDLGRVATDVIELYDPLAEDKGVALALEGAGPGPAELPGDPSLLFEAIGNLVDNAIKFTPAGGRVTVRVVREDGRLGIAVADTGPGIPAAERGAVLRRFYRAEKSRHTAGSGLGLSLVAAVARLHGLRLAIEDAAPGCRVTLWRESLVAQA